MLATTDQTAHTIGTLCVAGDAACARGDLRQLGAIVDVLTAYFEEPVHCALAELAAICRRDPKGAPAAWTELKRLLFRGRTG